MEEEVGLSVVNNTAGTLYNLPVQVMYFPHIHTFDIFLLTILTIALSILEGSICGIFVDVNLTEQMWTEYTQTAPAP